MEHYHSAHKLVGLVSLVGNNKEEQGMQELDVYKIYCFGCGDEYIVAVKDFKDSLLMFCPFCGTTGGDIEVDYIGKREEFEI